MAKMSKRELDEIVKRDLPGYDVLRREPADAPEGTTAEPDEVAPSIDELRRKYLGEGDEDDAADAPPPAAEADNTDDEIITVVPKKPADPFDHAARPKTVVVSGKDKRVIGSQG